MIRFWNHRKAALSESQSGIDDPSQFKAIIDRERTRADRTKRGFSLLTLKPRSAQDGPGQQSSPSRLSKDQRFLAQTLKQRIRVTDELGLVDQYRLGVVLPGTSPAGAWALAHDLLEKTRDAIPSPECQVYFYPSEHFDERPAREDELESNRTAQNSKHSIGGLATSNRPMEPLFARSLPGWKRGIDLTGATIGLIGLSPLLLAVGLAIRLSSPGPAIFTQWRSGLANRPFRIFKFRSMVIDAHKQKQELLERNEQNGPAFKITNDPRITWIGRLIRKTSIDELPQLWNVLRGEMTLVGPRPLLVEETNESYGWHRRRLDITPGLTCIWQLDGDRESFSNWVRMDVQYLQSHSITQDLRLILRTLATLLFRKTAA